MNRPNAFTKKPREKKPREKKPREKKPREKKPREKKPTRMKYTEKESFSRLENMFKNLSEKKKKILHSK